MKRNDLYSQSIALWGHTAQVDMAIEEMAELTQALCKTKRSVRPESWRTDVYEEIADVQIMLDQMVIIFDGEEIVPAEIERKLARLKERLKRDEEWKRK
jgi:allophanate hydrolase subunit 1